MRAQALFFILAAAGSSQAAERLTITASHELPQARPSETITVPWAEVNRALPGALLQKITVRDASGKALPYQVTNVLPEAKDPEGKGIAYGELIFQHDFAPGERSATFTVEKSSTVAPPFPSKVSARYVPERLDDFAWENDKVAHRTYGPALGAPAEPGSGKEVLVTSGLDIWFKRVDYPVVDRWYNKGHDHYHHDEGEGMDMCNARGRRYRDLGWQDTVHRTQLREVEGAGKRAGTGDLRTVLRQLGCSWREGFGSKAFHRRCGTLLRPD